MRTSENPIHAKFAERLTREVSRVTLHAISKENVIRYSAASPLRILERANGY